MARKSGKYDELLQFGSTHERLTSVGVVRSNLQNGQREYLFICECGTITWQSGSMVARGKVLSCGCYARDAAASRCKNREKHGLSKTPIYNIWSSMMRRCYSPTVRSYRFYGGRGVKVCSRWQNFEVFCRDVQPLLKPGMQMDRTDTYGDYEPGNIRFITCKENQRNRRDNRLIEIDGVVKCASEWAEEFGIKPTLFLQRIDRDGMNPKQALTYKKYKEN